MRCKKKRSWLICVLFVLLLVLNVLGNCTRVYASGKIKLNKTDITIAVGESTQLKVTGTTKKIKWTSDHKEIAKVSSGGKLTAKKKGTAVITAKVGSKRLKCKVKVRNANKSEQILKLVNKERKKRGLEAVKMDKTLNKAANKRAKELGKVFNHVRPDGTACFTVLNEYNIDYYMAEENIAAGQTSAKMVMDSWMHSQGHKDNILNPDVRKIGVGYYKKSGDWLSQYWVQLFTD